MGLSTEDTELQLCDTVQRYTIKITVISYSGEDMNLQLQTKSKLKQLSK